MSSKEGRSRQPQHRHHHVRQQQLQLQQNARIPHLDGLRAVALMGVLLFHFKIPWFSGGFVGVDMFFTLSGFLITRNILHDLDRQTFSLFRFYKRRFYRLYPASLVVILMVLLVSFMFIKPMYHEAISESAIAALTFWSNVHFHGLGEYFAIHFEMRPLLHFWSLSIEEQFYTFWPLLIMLGSRRGLNVLKGILWLTAVLSFSFAIKIYTYHATFAFYLLPARIFQFAAGGLLCVHLKEVGKLDKLFTTSQTTSTGTSSEQQPRSEQPVYFEHGIPSTFKPTTSYPRKLPPEINDFNDVVSLLMSIVIFISFVCTPPNPSAIYLIPVTLATCFLIAVPNAVMCEIFLCSSIFKFLGKISYSVYLVHWPIFVLGGYIFEASGIACPKVVLVFLSIWLGSILHYFVEQPWRRGASLLKRISLFGCLIFTMLFAVGGIYFDGYRFRFPEDEATGWGYGVKERFFWDVCLDVRGLHQPVHSHLKICRVGDVNGTESDHYFFGDSFTRHLSVGLDAIGRRRGIYFDLRYVDFCGFRALDHPRSQARALEGYPCSDVVSNMWDHVEKTPINSTIVIANWWGEPTKLENTLVKLQEAVNAKGKHLGIVAEPPGVSVEHKSYYSCADISVLPIGRMLSKIINRNSRGGERCLDFDRGIIPGHTFAEEQPVYQDTFRKELNGSKLINVFPHLCKRKIYGIRGRPTYRCRPAANIDEGVVHDIGYEPDLTHLTSVGSYNLSDIIERELFG